MKKSRMSVARAVADAIVRSHPGAHPIIVKASPNGKASLAVIVSAALAVAAGAVRGKAIMDKNLNMGLTVADTARSMAASVMASGLVKGRGMAVKARAKLKATRARRNDTARALVSRKGMVTKAIKKVKDMAVRVTAVNIAGLKREGQ
jgi:hypothetical protein